MEIAMLLKISTISFLFSLCSANAPTVKRQAIPAENFILQEPNDDFESHNDPTDRNLRKKDRDRLASIQYAPLYMPSTIVKTDEEKYHKTNFEEAFEGKKKKLEPNLNSYPQSALPYVPGHNIQILQSVNRGPGILEYRSITTAASTSLEDHFYEKSKMDYHRDLPISRNRHQEPKDIPPPTLPDDHFNGNLRLTDSESKEKYLPEPNILDQQLQRNHETLQDIHELSKQIEAQRVVGYPKINALLLNLARVYSPRVQSANQRNYLNQAEIKGHSNEQHSEGKRQTSHYENKRNWKLRIAPETFEY